MTKPPSDPLAGSGGVIDRVIDQNLTYLPKEGLIDLADRVRAADAAAVPGSVVEAGCALGGSAIVLAAAKSADRALYVYDVFDRIPPPTEQDGRDVHQRYEVIASGQSTGIRGEVYYGYRDDLADEVEAAFDRFSLPIEPNNVHLVKGLYDDTLWPVGPVAVAHIDCDWYESVTTCLTRIHPNLSSGGVLVIDDYDHWSGCRRAVDEFLLHHPGYRMERKSRLHLVKAG